jgi:hypothetical protein
VIKQSNHHNYYVVRNIIETEEQTSQLIHLVVLPDALVREGGEGRGIDAL